MSIAAAAAVMASGLLVGGSSFALAFAEPDGAPGHDTKGSQPTGSPGPSSGQRPQTEQGDSAPQPSKSDKDKPDGPWRTSSKLGSQVGDVRNGQPADGRGPGADHGPPSKQSNNDSEGTSQTGNQGAGEGDGRVGPGGRSSDTHRPDDPTYGHPKDPSGQPTEQDPSEGQDGSEGSDGTKLPDGSGKWQDHDKDGEPGKEGQPGRADGPGEYNWPGRGDGPREGDGPGKGDDGPGGDGEHQGWPHDPRPPWWSDCPDPSDPGGPPGDPSPGRPTPPLGSGGGSGGTQPSVGRPTVPEMRLPAPLPTEVLPAVPGVPVEPALEAAAGLATAAAALPFAPLTLPVIVIPSVGLPGGAGGAGAGGAGGPGLGPRPGAPEAPRVPNGKSGKAEAPSSPAETLNSPSYRVGYGEYLRAAGLGQVAAVAVPGLTGILALTGAGGLLGYRQARAGHVIRVAGTGRFVG